jgi:hypothetical protein
MSLYQLMCKSGKKVSRMIALGDTQTMLDVYRTALTSEIMDSKQSEYYTDYGIYGMSDASQSDYDKNVQPNPMLARDSEAIKLSEMWFYEVIDAQYIKFRMRPTEDQKQVVTGSADLYN